VTFKPDRRGGFSSADDTIRETRQAYVAARLFLREPLVPPCRSFTQMGTRAHVTNR